MNSYETTDVNEVLNETDVLYVTRVQKERGSIHDYELGMDQLNLLPKDAIVMHCLPAYRSKEITDEVFEHKKSRIFDQAENRMHAQQALLSFLLL